MRIFTLESSHHRYEKRKKRLSSLELTWGDVAAAGSDAHNALNSGKKVEFWEEKSKKKAFIGEILCSKFFKNMQICQLLAHFFLNWELTVRIQVVIRIFTAWTHTFFNIEHGKKIESIFYPILKIWVPTNTFSHCRNDKSSEQNQIDS